MLKKKFFYFYKNISEEIRDLTANDIGQTSGTFSSADIGGQLGRHWADIGALGKHCRT